MAFRQGYISNDVKQNLISNTYLHSNKGNFYEVADTHSILETKTNPRYRELVKQANRLKSIIDYLENLENQFYQEFNVKTPEEFSQKYLNSDKYISNNSSQIINGITQKELNKFAQLMKQDAEIYAKLFSGTAKDEEGFSIKFNKRTQVGILLEEIFANNITKESLSKELGKILTKGKLKGGQVKSIETMLSKSLGREIKILTQKSGEITTNSQKVLEEFSLKRIEQLKSNQSMLREKIREDLAKVKKIDKDLIPIDLVEDFTNSFIKFVKESLKVNEASLTISSNYIKGIGDIGEIDMGLLFSSLNGLVLQEDGKEIVKQISIQMLGSSQKTRYYYSHKPGINPNTGEKDNYLNSTEKTIEHIGESPTDMSITVKDSSSKTSKTYNFQIKNSFVEKGWASITIQQDILIDTLLTTMFKEGIISGKGNSPKELLYLFANIFFFQHNGDKSYNRMKVKESTSESDVYHYANVLLQQGLNFLLEMKFAEELNKTQKEFQENNIFFIYKGKYLIPISWFFKSALEMMNNFLDINTKEDYQSNGLITIGNASMHKLDTEESKAAFPNPIDFREKKQKLLPNDNLIKYPDPLLSYGANAGKRLVQSVKFGKIRLNANIEAIEAQFMSKGGRVNV